MTITIIIVKNCFIGSLGKRGKRVGVVDAEGNPLYSFNIKHGATGICWEPATDTDIVRPGKKPRPGIEDLVRLIPPESDISRAQLFNAVAALSIGVNRARQLLKELRFALNLDARGQLRYAARQIEPLERKPNA